MIGHFTQVVRDQAYAVGCAMVQFKKGRWHTTIYGCEYLNYFIFFLRQNNFFILIFQLLTLQISFVSPQIGDYSLTNINGYRIYEKSSRTASGCKTGRNKDFSGLCSPKEIFNNDLYYKT